MRYKRIKDLRIDKDLKQIDIAKQLNIGRMTYCHYELGDRDIPTQILCDLADYYNVSTDYLLGRTDIPKPYPKNKK